MQTLMQMDCIPAGMELFPAMDEEQFNFIKRIIDDCDYYVLIIGGRYGSLSSEGISYTELEYEYAVKKNIKVIALIHSAVEDIPLGKSEQSHELREKLNAFREKVRKGRLVKFWSQAGDLPQLVMSSLMMTIKTYPAIGWIRGNAAANEDILQQVNSLRVENEVLRAEIGSLKEALVSAYPELAQGDDVHQFCITHTVYHGARRSHEIKEDIALSWDQIFSIIAPSMISPVAEHSAKLAVQLRIGEYAGRSSVVMRKYDVDTIGQHFVALGILNIYSATAVKGGMATFWNVTEKGKQLLAELRMIRRDQASHEQQ